MKFLRTAEWEYPSTNEMKEGNRTSERGKTGLTSSVSRVIDNKTPRNIPNDETKDK